MYLNIEIFDRDGRMIDTYKVSETTDVVDLVNVNHQDDKFIITPIIATTVTKIKLNNNEIDAIIITCDDD